MSEFDDRVRDSEVLSNLRQAVEILAQLQSNKWEHQRVIHLIDRLQVVARNVLDRLTLANRWLVTEQMLSDLQEPSQQIISSIHDIANMPLSDEPDYGSIIQYCDDLLARASALPVVTIRTTPEVLQKAAEQFDREVTSSTAELTEKMDAIRSQLTDADRQAQESSDNFQRLVADSEATMNQRVADAESHTNQSLSQIHSMAEALLQEARDAGQRVNHELTNIHDIFRKSEDQRAEEFLAFQARREESQTRRDEEYQEWLGANKNEIADLQEQARTMLEEVAGASSAEHYSKLREEQNAAANLWRRVGVGALSLSIAIAIGVFVFYTATSADIDLSATAIIGRYSIVFSSLILATYALKQSGHHRRREQDLSRVANELMLLWPFINRLPETERIGILEKITPEYFRGGLTPQDAGDKVGLLDQGSDLLRRRNRGQRDE